MLTTSVHSFKINNEIYYTLNLYFVVILLDNSVFLRLHKKYCKFLKFRFRLKTIHPDLKSKKKIKINIISLFAANKSTE